MCLPQLGASMSDPRDDSEPIPEDQKAAVDDHNANGLPRPASAKGNATTPSYKEVAKNYFQPALELWNCFVWRFIVLLAGNLKPYDGLITAGATIFIAWFTIELATYASRQEGILNHQILDSEVTQRAFVLAQGLHQEPETDKDGKPVGQLITPTIKNTGNTPATSLSYITITPENQSRYSLKPGAPVIPPVFATITLRSPADPEDYFLEALRKKDSEITINAYLAPQTELPLVYFENGTRMNIQEWNAIIRAQKIGYLYGSIHYVDAFGESHISKYCYDLNTIHFDTGGRLQFAPPLCRHWNCTDKDCDKDKAAYNQEAVAVLEKLKKNPDAFPGSP